MRNTILIAAVLAAVFAPLVSAQSTEGYYGGSYSRMSFIKGNVYVQHGQDAGFEQGELNLVALEGDKIGTKDGRVELQLGRRNYLRMGDYSQVDIVTLPRRDGDRTKINLLAGSAYVRIDSLDSEKNFEIHTPDASFYVLERGLYRIEVRENRETEFAVFSGSAEAAAEEGSVVVGSREQITAANGRLLSAPESLVSGRDEFGDWNASRDAVFARKLDRTYLPADYYDYEVELADNGRWVNEAEYGNVWVPNSSYSDWRPYYNGRWSWYPIIGWTWVSYDPWGWCTSHYGRWGWGSGLGWYWIPQRHWGWGPAWVHWYGERDYLGWCPLSYYNYPAVVMNNRFYGRYSNGYYPNGSMALTVVHRDQLQNRRLSQVALDRGRVGQLGNISLRSAQPNRRPALNADGDIASRARQTLSRDGLRSVGKNFSSSGKRLSSQDLRSNSSSGREGAVGASPSRRTVGNPAGSVDSGRTIRSSSGNTGTRSPARSVGSPAVSPERRTVERGSVNPVSGGTASPSRVRSFPSRSVSENKSSGSTSAGRDGASSSRIVSNPPARTGNSGSVGSSRSRETVGRDAVRSYPSRKIGGDSGSPSLSSTPSNSGRSVSSGTVTPRSRNDSSSSSTGRSLQREYGGGVSGSSAPSRNIAPPSRSNSPSTSSSRAPSRRTEIPSRSYSAPSRSSSSPSPSYSAPSRSSSAPSRSYSAPSRSSSSSSPSYSAPSRSSSAPSRSYSAPSRSSSSPSYSSPSRSSSAPSRSYSAPSRSSSSPSRSSSGSSVSKGSGSSSSSSGGRVRRKD